MVRLCKDFLHVGQFVIGFREDGTPILREFTPADLAAYVARFGETQEAGIPTPLRWGHGDGVGDTDDTQSEADIAEVWADNERAYFGVYVTPEDAARLKKKQRPCSPALEPNFMDGTGRVWPGYTLKHVAMVSHATVPDQLPFIQMGLPAPTPKGKKMPLSFDVLSTGLDRLAKAIDPGSGLPEGLTEDNFDEMFPMFVDMLVGKEEAEDPATEEAPPVNDPTADGSSDPVVMSLKSTVESLAAQVKALTDEKSAGAEQVFRGELTAMLAAGLPAKNEDLLLELGSRNGWATRLLDPYRDAPALALGSKTKGLKTAKEPATGAKFTEEERAKARRLLGRKPKED